MLDQLDQIAASVRRTLKEEGIRLLSLNRESAQSFRGTAKLPKSWAQAWGTNRVVTVLYRNDLDEGSIISGDTLFTFSIEQGVSFYSWDRPQCIINPDWDDIVQPQRDEGPDGSLLTFGYWFYQPEGWEVYTTAKAVVAKHRPTGRCKNWPIPNVDV